MAQPKECHKLEMKGTIAPPPPPIEIIKSLRQALAPESTWACLD